MLNVTFCINLFSAIPFFLHPLESPGNLWFSDVSTGVLKVTSSMKQINHNVYQLAAVNLLSVYILILFIKIA